MFCGAPQWHGTSSGSLDTIERSIWLEVILNFDDQVRGRNGKDGDGRTDVT